MSVLDCGIEDLIGVVNYLAYLRLFPGATQESSLSHDLVTLRFHL